MLKTIYLLTFASYLHHVIADNYSDNNQIGNSPNNSKFVRRKRTEKLFYTEEDRIELGVCQVYNGTTCENYLRNQTVFITPDITMEILEDRLTAAYGVIRESKDMNPNCRIYALPSLCFSILPICRTPEKTNHQYFAQKAEVRSNKPKTKIPHEKKSNRKKVMRMGTKSSLDYPTTASPTSTTEKLIVYFSGGVTPGLYGNSFNGDMVTDNVLNDQLRRRRRKKRGVADYYSDSDFHKRKFYLQQGIHGDAGYSTYASPVNGKKYYPPTRNTENLRRICRDDCELLENELCQKEYAIAKRHPTIGQKLPLEECYDLPQRSTIDGTIVSGVGGISSTGEVDCMRLGIHIDILPSDDCYWENGVSYRGTMDKSQSGKSCLKWVRNMREISDYPELAGHNYCRNPGGEQASPWCYVDVLKTIEFCTITKCSDKMWLFIIIGFISFSSLIILTVTVVCCRKYKKHGVSNIQNINLPNADKNIYGNSRLNSPIEMTSLIPNQNMGGAGGGGNNANGGIQGLNNSLQSQNTSTRNNGILRVPQYILQDVQFVEELGEGAFGKVYKGELLQKNGEKIFVAVKALKENASVKTQTDFKREIELISDLRHDNIVCILGVVLKEEPLCMLFEYMAQGDLHEFLIANSPNESKQLTQLQFLMIAMQICEGMEYLANHHYVHRDLAARNCLVGENLTVKISDFGLSRDIYSSDYYRVQSKSLLPVRWMPSESILYGKFTTESDVWSFGVVLWEIYSYGLQPYYGYSNQEVINMVRARQLLPCPEACPSAVYSLMVECWHEQAVRRPTFPEIGHRLKIWYQAQKRSELNEQGFNRKGSILSVNNQRMSSQNNLHSPYPVTTPSSSSSHQSLNRDRHLQVQQIPSQPNDDGASQQQQQPPSQLQPQQKKSLHHHSLEREKILRNSHQHNHQHRHHQHHHSLDRSNSSKLEDGQSDTQSSKSFYNNSGTSRSNKSINSMQEPQSSQQYKNFSLPRKSLDGNLEYGEELPHHLSNNYRSREMKMKPPKDPHHHHHHHHHHNQTSMKNRRIDSVGGAGNISLSSLNTDDLPKNKLTSKQEEHPSSQPRKLSVSGSVSSVLNDSNIMSTSMEQQNSIMTASYHNNE